MRNDRFKEFIMEQGLFISWGIAVVATIGSLYFSEIMGFVPCLLCWYQRIIMYPLVVLLGMGAVRKDHGLAVYIFPLALVGALTALFHYLQQKIPGFNMTGDACGPIPCTTEYINWFGFITIPFLALIAFLAIAAIHILLWSINKRP